MSGYIETLRLRDGFGFIAQPGIKDDVFFHADELRDDMQWDDSLKYRRVEFDLARDDRTGRRKAVNVRPAID